jgi:hypothetical protein
MIGDDRMTNEQLKELNKVLKKLNGLVEAIENYDDVSDLGETLIDCVERLKTIKEVKQ